MYFRYGSGIFQIVIFVIGSTFLTIFDLPLDWFLYVELASIKS